MRGRINPGGRLVPARLVIACVAVTWAAVTWAAMTTVTWATPQPVELIKDINTDPLPRGSTPAALTPAGDRLYFTATTDRGRDIWSTDGTQAGTELLRDLPLLSNFGGPQDPAVCGVVGDTLYLTLGDATGYELWRSDGTAEGTFQLKDIDPRVNRVRSGTFGSCIELGGRLLFAAQDEAYGSELWRSDGTEGGTVPVRDVVPGPDGGGAGFLMRSGDTAYFRARVSGGSFETELWKSDGTEAGTMRVAEINPGGNASPSFLTDVGGTLYFAANGGDGPELWRTDGTEAGTVKIDIDPDGFGSNPQNMIDVDGVVYFDAQSGTDPRGLWRHDPSTGVTERISDRWPNVGLTAESRRMAYFDGAVYFPSDDGVHGDELWRYVLATGATELLDISEEGSSFPRELTVIGDSLFLVASGQVRGRDLWRVAAGARAASRIELNPGGFSSPFGLTEFQGDLYCAASDAEDGYELWRVNGGGTAHSKIVVAPDATNPSRPLPGIALDGTLYFSANDGRIDPEDGTAENRELWKSDGSEAGTVLVADLHPDGSSDPREMVILGGSIYFTADDGSTGRELWRHNPGDGSTNRVTDLNPGSGSAFEPFSAYGYAITPVGGLLFLRARDAAGEGLWSHDPAGSGTEQIQGSRVSEMTALDGVLYFVSQGEVWSHDPDSGATLQVAEINPAGSADPRTLTAFEGMLYFSADDGTVGRELWRHDPAAGVTERLTEINPGGSAIQIPRVDSRTGQATPFASIGNTLVFSANDGATGWEPWRYDITHGMAEPVADLHPEANSFPRLFKRLGEALLFFAGNATQGEMLWKLNSPTAEPELVVDPDPWDNSSRAADQARVVGERLYFTAPHSFYLLQNDLWQSDGTAEGTEAIEIEPGRPLGISNLIDLDARLLFNVERFSRPGELYRLADDEERTVRIDIKPRTSTNCVHIDGEGVVPVAILGEADFDVDSIDIPSLRFEGLAVGTCCGGKLNCRKKKVDDDPYLDLACQFTDDLERWTGSAPTGNLSGVLEDGTRLRGRDALCLVD